MRMIATFMTKYFASQYCVFFSNQMCIQHPIAYFFLNSNKSLIFMCFQVITITRNLKMDSTVSSFLNEGSLDSTTKSHRTAARTYHTFLLNQSLSSRLDSLQLSKTQMKDLNDWNPMQQPHLPLQSLVLNSFCARFLIHTLKQIEKELFGNQ